MAWNWPTNKPQPETMVTYITHALPCIGELVLDELTAYILHNPLRSIYVCMLSTKPFLL